MIPIYTPFSHFTPSLFPPSPSPSLYHSRCRSFFSGETEPKPAGSMAACPMNNQSHAASSFFSVIGGGDFSRISSELDLEEFVSKAVIVPEITNGSVNDEDVKPGEFRCQRDRGFTEPDAFFGGVCSDDLSAAFQNTVSALLVRTAHSHSIRTGSTLEMPFVTSSSGLGRL